MKATLMVPRGGDYDRRAPEYDDWYLGTGLFAARVRPGWHEEVEALRLVCGRYACARFWMWHAARGS
jgi:hypothetical protein